MLGLSGPPIHVAIEKGLSEALKSNKIERLFRLKGLRLNYYLNNLTDEYFTYLNLVILLCCGIKVGEGDNTFTLERTKKRIEFCTNVRRDWPFLINLYCFRKKEMHICF